MAQSGSISRQLHKLKRGDEQALEQICDRYYDQIAALARRKLGRFPRRVTDEFAIANEVLLEMHTRAQRGDFDNVTGRDELLPLLIRLTHDRVVDEIRRYCAQKRGGGRTRGHSIFAPNDDSRAVAAFDRFRGAIESPSTRQVILDQLRDLVGRLPDETMRAVLLLRADGYTNEEIGRELNVSLATVERKRKRIRDILSDIEPTRQTST